ncbi:MAG: Spy/CpxP family protein refolding chaperone [Cyanobacteria bacterium P01_H01_bin.58]
MQRLLKLGFMSLATAATIALAPLGGTSAIAQTLPIFEELELTEAQQTEVRALFADGLEDISEVLTEDQKAQFREAYQESQNFRTAAAAVENLTDDQKDELRTVVRESLEAMGDVLTDDQKAELRTLIRERRQSRR